MQKISGRLGTAALLATSFLGVALCAPVSAARHHYRHSAYRVASRGSYENALGGIHLGDSVFTLIHRYGNPSEVQLERIMLTSAGGGAAGGMGGGYPGAGGMGGGTKTVPVKIFVGPSSSGQTGIGGSGSSGPGAPGMGGPGMGAPGMGGMGGALGGLGVGSLFQNYGEPPIGGGYPGAPGGYPGMGGPGMGAPGMGGPSGYPGMGGPGMGAPGMGGMGGPGAGGPGAGTLITPEHPELRFIYDEPNANSLEFTLSPTGRVEQIRATGYHGFVRTRRDVTLGEKYDQVLVAYGYPENQQYSGPGDAILTTDYTSRAHCSFQFYNQRLVGITVAQVD